MFLLRMQQTKIERLKDHTPGKSSYKINQIYFIYLIILYIFV